MSEPSQSIFSLLSLAYRGDVEMLEQAIALIDPADLPIALQISLMAQADEVPAHMREHAAAVASTMAARAGGQQ